MPLDSNKKMIKSADGYQGVKYIDELFKIEEKIANLSVDEKVRERKEKSEPVLKKFYEWVNLTSKKYITNKKLKEESELLHSDETTMQCNKEQGRKASSNSYMWVIASGELEKNKGVIFSYSKSRSSEVAQKLLKGYKEILVTDRIRRI